MAIWQADYAVAPPGGELPEDYRALLDQVLPRADSWADDLEIWGVDDGDRIDVVHCGAREYEMFARFDLRNWRPDLYDRFLAFVRGTGATLHVAPLDAGGPQIDLTHEAFQASLLASNAFRFVLDPEAYLRSLPRQRREP